MLTRSIVRVSRLQEQIEKISPIAGASYAEVMTGVYKPIAERLGGEFARKIY